MTQAALPLPPHRIPARLILAQPLRALSTAGRRRLNRVLEHEADREPTATVRQAVEREIDRVLKDILRLPLRARAESSRAFERMRARMAGEVAALPPTISDATIDRMRRAWLSELNAFADELTRRHTILERDAKRLGAKLGTLPAQVVDLDIAPPRLDPGRDARGYYRSLRQDYGEEPSDRIANILDSVKRGLMGANDGKLAIAHIIQLPAHRGELIMRQELGRAAQESNQVQLERLGLRMQGLAKEWSSARLSSTREGHLEAHGQVVAHDEPFLVRATPDDPFERLMYPKDPAGSPANTMNCACVSRPRVDDVSIRPSRALR